MRLRVFGASSILCALAAGCGGSSGVDAGSDAGVDFCTHINDANAHIVSGAQVCASDGGLIPDGGFMMAPMVPALLCEAAVTLYCSPADQMGLNAFTGCLLAVPPCQPGQELSWAFSLLGCYGDLSKVSKGCLTGTPPTDGG